MNGSQPPARRVAVTGLGIVSSLGDDLEQVADRLRTGRSGVAVCPQWREKGLKSWVAGRYDLAARIARSQLGPKRLERMGEVSALAALAAEDAFEQASLDAEQRASPRFGCLVGAGVGSMPTIHEGAALIDRGQARRIRPHSLLQSMSSAPSAHLVHVFGIGGRSYSLAAACSTSSHSIGHAFELIRGGLLDGALAGGAEEINVIVAAAFNAMRAALSTRWNATPERASRPFDAGRDGFVLSGGAGVMVLEELGAARRRGVRVLGEVIGYAANSEPFDLILPEPAGRSAAACMRAALADAGIEPPRVDYLNAHATGTPTGDVAEVRAARAVFGPDGPPIAAPKSLAGHALGAAGAQEAIYSLVMMEHGFLAGSANVDEIDPELADAPILTATRETPSRVHLSNSFGFGGTNASLVLAAAPA
ncbi:MAG TPA: beta-ketoacyl synthase N-terminal-like domain-containing protein [Thermoanaerobaculia bacterium]|nr:beta-ketoacyl synthase N-terminal-like domain-containing protein [Thermoanaerobaculia bacterium]